MSNVSPTFDPKAFRNALGSFATGVTVITTTAADGTPVGLTANSFNSVSIEPPMVLWSLAKKAHSLPVFMEAQHWAVHVLATDQEDLSNRFARAGEDKFSGLNLKRNEHGVPLLEGCAARFECETSFRYEGGDHIIFVGQVLSFQRVERAPLVFHAGRYAQAASKAAERPARQVGGFNEDLLGYMLGRSYFQFHQGLRPYLRAEGLSDAAWYAVAALTVRDGVTAEQLSQALSHSLETDAEPLLAKLAEADWVTIDRSAPDQRYFLTEAGRERSLRLLAAARAREEDILARLGEGDARVFKTLLQRFSQVSDPGLPDLWDSNKA